MSWVLKSVLFSVCLLPAAALAQTDRPAADILSVTLGMTLQEAKSSLSAADPAYKFEEYFQEGVGGEKFVSQLAARIMVPNPKAPPPSLPPSSSLSLQAQMEQQMRNQLRGVREEPAEKAAEEVQILFDSVPGRHGAISIGRAKIFPRASAPTVSVLEKGLNEKYRARPSYRSADEYGVRIWWAYDAKGKLINRSNDTCTNNAPGYGYDDDQATAGLIDSFQPECGLRIYSQIAPWRDNVGLARMVGVSIADGKAGYDALVKAEELQKSFLRTQRANELQRANEKPATKF